MIKKIVIFVISLTIILSGFLFFTKIEKANDAVKSEQAAAQLEEFGNSPVDAVSKEKVTGCAEIIVAKNGISYADLNDPNLKKIAAPGRYFKDNCNVYIGTQEPTVNLIPNAEPDTFVPVVVASVLVEGLACDTPENCTSIAIARDSKRVFSYSNEIPGADPNSFKLLLTTDDKYSLYAADASGAYYVGYDSFKLNEANIKSFRALDGITAQDETNTWINGKIK